MLVPALKWLIYRATDRSKIESFQNANFLIYFSTKPYGVTTHWNLLGYEGHIIGFG